jgi:peptidoglycan/xylan/chitin deacetylase (PgdA/CDA1 family)
MKFLAENNYKVISLSDAVRLIGSANNHPITQSPYPPIKYVVLTFDDGYKDFLTQAFPVLKKHGFGATVFLPTKFIDNNRSGLKGKEHLNWSEVRKLHEEDILFGAHTVTHRQLKHLREDEIEYEVRTSKEIIEAQIGHSVESFSYPFAFPEQDTAFTASFRTLLTNVGYKSCVSTRIGTVNRPEDTLSLKRIPINSRDDVLFFKGKLEGAYDWLYKPQYLYKLLKNRIRGKYV